MGALIIFMAVLAVAAIIEVFAQTHGVDSRPDFEDPRAPAHGIYT
ncbi:MAG: hypothetical protein ABI620_05385 [Chloroflexota bacterium]